MSWKGKLSEISEHRDFDPEDFQAGAFSVGAEYKAVLQEKSVLTGKLRVMSEHHDFDPEDFQAGAFAVGAQYKADLLLKSKLTEGSPTGLVGRVNDIGHDGTKFHVYIAPIDTGETHANYQRKCFYSGKYFFVFYIKEGMAKYKSSIDSKTWGDAVDVIAESAPDDFCIWFDGTYVYTVWVEDPPDGDELHFRRGIPSEGIINWDTDYLAHKTGPNEHHGWVSIACDSDGLPFLSTVYQTVEPPGYELWVYRNSKPDGSGVWTGTKIGNGQHSAIVPLMNKKMYVAYERPYYGSYTVYGKLWNGSSWSEEENVINYYWGNHDCWSVTSFGDKVYIAASTSRTNGLFPISFRERKDSWGDIEVAGSFAGLARPTICALGDVIYIFVPYHQSIRLMIRKDQTWSDWFTFAADDRVAWGTSQSAFARIYFRKGGILWTGDPDYVRFVAFDFRKHIAAQLREKES